MTKKRTYSMLLSDFDELYDAMAAIKSHSEFIKWLEREKKKGEKSEHKRAEKREIKKLARILCHNNTVLEELVEILPREFGEWSSVALDISDPKVALKKFCGDKTTSPRVLTVLSKEENPIIRKAVARNQKTPKRILSKLLRDKDISVRRLAKKVMENR